MSTIFISRSLDREDPLYVWALRNGWTLIDKSLLTFTGVPFELPPPVDWWFFYSPRAFQYSMHKLPALARLPLLGAIGPGTGEFMRKAGYEVNFTGCGRPKETAEDFGKVAAGKSVFFPHAQRSRQSVRRHLGNIIKTFDAICYMSDLLVPDGIINADVYIFTSPSCAEAYLTSYSPMPGAKLIAYGSSTSEYLHQQGYAHAILNKPGTSQVVDWLEENGYSSS